MKTKTPTIRRLGLVAGVLTGSLLGITTVAHADIKTVDSTAALASALADKSVSAVQLSNDILIAFDDIAEAGRSYRFTLDHEVEIDLNGHNLTDNEATECKTASNGPALCNMFELSEGAKLTLSGEGTITAGRYSVIADAADVIIDGPDLVATKPASYGVYTKNDGSATIKSGSVTADYAAFAGNNTTGDMNFYVNGGTLTSLHYPAIYMPGQVFLEMTDGTLNGGIAARIGQIKISGGEINGQVDALSNDGLDQNYSGMPSMTEGIALIAGSYKSNNATYGNSLVLEVTGGTINDGINLYDLGNTASGYEQDVTVKLKGGNISAFSTKFTEDEIGFPLKAGHTAGHNNANGRIAIDITGGTYKEAPVAAYIADDYETFNTAEGYAVANAAELAAEGMEYVDDDEDGIYELGTIDVDWQGYTADTNNDSEIRGAIEFVDSFVADRKSSVFIADQIQSANTSLAEETDAPDLVGLFDITLRDRNNDVISVADTNMTVIIELTEEQYNKLSGYDSVKAVYFNDNGAEEDRMDAEIASESVDDNAGTATYYYAKFSTHHLSSYGLIGVNNEADAEETESVETPDTGAFGHDIKGLATAIASIGAAAIISLGFAVARAIKRTR